MVVIISQVKGFFAYQSYPEDLNETIEKTIDQLNSSGVIEVKGWKNNNVVGNNIIKEILDEIDKREVFICDLTYLNFNVLFELGYAIGKNKKVWIVLNPDVENSNREYAKLKMLTTIGYASYSNSQSLVEKFYKEQPYENLDKTILVEETSKITLNNNNTIFYLKSPIDSDASMQLTVLVNNSTLPKVIDDAKEMGTQPLNWYIKNIMASYGVVVHFVSESHENSCMSNAKNSLISGLVRGLDVELLMLAHAPFEPPIDYSDVLKVHSTASKCKEYAEEWLNLLESCYKERKSDYGAHIKKKKALTELQTLFIGEPVAEHEHKELSKYFVETSEYLEALKSQQMLFIGRKGTGKTANLYKLADELTKDKRNFICVIQPVGHEIEGVLDLLKQSKPNSEKGYLVESIWKYLIYTELAKTVFRNLKNRPHYVPLSEHEQDLLTFVERNQKMINADFTLRLENAIKSLNELSDYDSIESKRLKVSEILHSTVIKQLRHKLGNILHGNKKVSILVDNLDASWNSGSDLKELSGLLFSLLMIVKKITGEFQSTDYRNQSVNLSLIVFLRSDIFTQILSYANERDKIQHTKMVWHDPELLFRVIEARINYSVEFISSPEELWSKFFCLEVDRIPLKEYVINLIIPRPRDIIFFFRAAIQEAVNRGHAKVEESDFKSAEFIYSQFALDSLLAENGNRVDDLESVISEFAGVTSALTIDELNQVLSDAGILNKEDAIDLLFELTFLGLETQKDKFEFFDQRRGKRILYKLAERTVKTETKVQRFKINRAFYAYLDIKD